ncbi:MAG: MBL fold metallo-hydrolase [Cyclobacteriaceae bacterium]|nr:MBL fold metallo-hydrolase [Cyclobacteriaceae bacterium]
MYVLAITAVIVLLVAAAFSGNSAKDNRISSYMSNPNLKSVHPDPAWKGNPVDERGRFMNLYQPFISETSKLLKWQLSKNPYKEQKKEDTRRPDTHVEPDLFTDTEDKIVWLGHASFFIRMNGINMLIDPVFFDSPFLKRETVLPFDPEQATGIDYILVSHDHRDHCDKKTLEFLAGKNPEAKVFTGLEMKPLLSSWMPGLEIEEAAWYQQFKTEDVLEVTYVPSRHWSRRGLFDENTRLWGGFFMKDSTKSVYFMSDSGAGPHFSDIKDICGAPDFCLMGIGAYKPEWFMHPVHISPADALKAFEVMEGKYFIPMHYGTFDLSDEPFMEPVDQLKVLAGNKQQHQLLITQVGEVVALHQPLVKSPEGY